MSSFVSMSYDLRTTLGFCYHLKNLKNCRIAYNACQSIHWTCSDRSQCFEKKFKSGNFNVRNEERGKPPKKFEDKNLQALLNDDRLHWLLPPTNSRFKSKNMWKRPEYAKKQHRVILHHENLPSHTAKRVTDTIVAFKLEILTHAMYSTDLPPSEYHLSLEHALAEKYFDSYENVWKFLDNWFPSNKELFFAKKKYKVQWWLFWITYYL